MQAVALQFKVHFKQRTKQESIECLHGERDRLFVIGSIMTLILGLMGVVLLAIVVLDLWT